MINRVLIRLKIIQIVYAYYQNGSKNLDSAEKELFFSLSKAYDLYNYLLMLMVALTTYAQKRIDAAKSKLAPTAEELYPNMKFVENKFVSQLEVNKQLMEFAANQKRSWTNDEDFIKGLYDKIIVSDIYKEYMASSDKSYEVDRELWRKLYKAFVFNNEELDVLLEDQSLYWNDDKEIVDTFVLKTIKRFEAKNGANQTLLPEFKDEEDQEFARRLFRRAILNCDYYRHLISENTRNWDLDRVAFMDVIIMQCALAEILSFPNIPVSVSLNEYVEIAKVYSTIKSGSFVNGTLDGIVNQLKKEGKLAKNWYLCWVLKTKNEYFMNLMTVFLQAPAAAPGGGSMMWILLIAMFAIMYFFMIRPQNKKQKEIANFRKSLQVNQKVITAGGIHGVIKEINDNDIVLEIASNVKIRIDKNSIFAAAADANSNQAAK